MRIWMGTRTMLKGKLHNQLDAQAVTAFLCPSVLALGTAHCASLAEMFVLAAVWWADLWKEGGRGSKTNGWEAGGTSYPRLFKQFLC